MSEENAPPPPPPPPPPIDFLPFVMAQPFSSAIEASSSALHAASNFAWLDYDDDNKFSDKSSSGLVGLSNQGATCYMNSLIQSLYMTPEVRSAMYKWTYDAENDGPKSECIPFQLQRLFARLQLSKRKYVETKDLTKSFGWLDSDAFQQHDVQELFRVLFDALERSYSRGMDLGGNSLVEHLYRGILEDYIQCTECKTTRVRADTFFDLQLVIKDVDNILTALDKYIEPELLCNDNQYTCEKCAKKVDALKGLRFKELPYLLCLQLKRFDFDWQNMQRIKLNNKVSFPVYLDISKYKHKGENEATDGKEYLYELFAILIASGGALGGHYFTYLKNFETGKWYNFNDSSVTELENPEQDIEKMYGEDSSNDKPEPSQDKFKKQSGWGTNAYMLVYRFIDPQTNKNLTDVTEIPKELADEIQKENEEFDQQFEKHKERKQSLALRINTEGKPPQTVIAQRSFTIRQATKAVWEAMVEESQRDTVPLECVRLRDYNIHKKLPSASFNGQEESTLSQLQFHQNKHLWFETRKPGEPFPNEDNMILNIVKVPPGKNYQEIAPVATSVPTGSSLGTLKKILSEKFDIPVDNLCVIKVAGSVQANILTGEEKDLKKDIGLLDGAVLYIEHSEFPADASKSSIAKQVEMSQYMIEISFNLPDEKTYDQELIIDKRSSVRELKATIGAMIGLSINEFKMIKDLGKHEYKRVDQSLEDAGFFDCAVVIIQRGEPLTEDQFQIQIFEYDYDKIEPWKSHDQVVLSANILMKDLKQILSDTTQIPIDQLRLRGKDGARASTVFDDDKTLKQSIPQLYDGKEVVVQRIINTVSDGINSIPTPTENQTLVELQQWYPSKWELGKRFEEVIPKDCNILHLKSLLSARCGIPVANIAVGKPRRYQMKDVSQLPLLVWDHPDDALLSQSPFSILDGELLLFKDLQDSEKVPLDELKGEKPATPVTQEKVHVPEPSIKIRTRYDKPLPEKTADAATPDANGTTTEQIPPPTKKLKEDGTSHMEEDIIVQSS